MNVSTTDKRVFLQRMVEAALIGLLAAGGTTYTLSRLTEVRVDHVIEKLEDSKESTDKRLSEIERTNNRQWEAIQKLMQYQACTKTDHPVCG